eukprot:1177504-Prorocentrum_minimum.AAC.1
MFAPGGGAFQNTLQLGRDPGRGPTQQRLHNQPPTKTGLQRVFSRVVDSPDGIGRGFAPAS